jgi:hypothetical protein
MYAPIVLTVYNRPKHTKRVIRALRANDLALQSDLFIYSDGPRTPKDRKAVGEVRKILVKQRGFKSVTVVRSVKNKGLAASVIQAVTEVINRYGKVIVLEDDLIVQKYFLNVMNQMLNFYERDSRIASVTAFMLSTRLIKLPSGYSADVFFNLRPSSYGWATWKNRWRKVDWDVKDFTQFLKDRKAQRKFNTAGKDLTPQLVAQQKGMIDSWAVRWAYHSVRNGLITVQTTKSYIQSIGYDSSGTHTRNENYFFEQDDLATRKELRLRPFEGKVDLDMVRRYTLHNRISWPYIKKKLLSKFGILIKF